VRKFQGDTNRETERQRDRNRDRETLAHRLTEIAIQRLECFSIHLGDLLQ